MDTKSNHPLASWLSGRPEMKQKDFAQKVKCSESHLSLVMQGERGLSLRLAGRIEEATGGDVTTAALLEAAPENSGAAR